MQKVQFIILGLILLALPVTSQGLFEESLNTSGSDDAFHISGFVRSLAYAGRYGDNKVYMKSFYSQAGLITELNAGKFGKGYGEIRYRYGNTYGEEISEFEIREAYADVFWGPLDIKAGKQVLSYGTTSFINPSNPYTPMDPTYRSPDPDDLRLGVWALSSIFTISPTSSLRINWFPQYTPSVLLTEPFSFPDYVEFEADVHPGLEISESSFSVQYDIRSRIFDLGLSYYNGYRNTPSIQTDTILFDPATMLPESIRLVKTPYRINAAGLNLSIPVGSYMLRMEGGWIDPLEADSIQLPFSELSYTAEIEQLGDNINITAGYYGKYIIDFQASDFAASLLGAPSDMSGLFPEGAVPDLQQLYAFSKSQVEGSNRLIDQQAEEFYHAAYAVMNLSVLHDQLEINVPAMYMFTTKELTLMPSITVHITDGLSFQLGAYYLHGKENSLFDAVSPVLNAGYGMLKVEF